MNRIENINNQTNKLFYTQKGDILTPEQRQFYEENGYIIIPNLVDPEDYKAYSQRFIDYCEEKLPRPPGMVVMRDLSLAKKGIKIKSEHGVTKIQDWQDDEVLFEFCKNPKTLQYVSDIIGPNVKTCHTMLINKPPNTGKTQRHPLHQDLAYFPFRSAERIVCCWSAMENISRENGGLVLYPGTHKMPFVEHGYPDWKEGVNKGYWGILDKYMPSKEAVKVHPTMKPGDCIFFHPHVLHGSGENKTQNFRKSISCHYAASECQYIDVKGTNNENIAKDTEKFVQQTYKLDVDYAGFWKRKMKCVLGKDLRSEGPNYV